MSEVERYDISQNGIYDVKEDEAFAVNEDYATLKAQCKNLSLSFG